MYALAWQQPLPVARKSACKYISLLATQDLSEDNIGQRNTAALHAAIQVFELPGLKQVAEWSHNKTIVQRQVVIHDRIKTVEKRIDSECKVDPAAVKILNDAAANPETKK